MQTLKLKNNLVAVERLTKPRQSNGDFFTIPEDSNSVGQVAFAGELGSLFLNKKVVFGTKYTELRVLGKDLLFMELDNVFAEVFEEEKA